MIVKALNKVKILYIHHTTALGGATNSLLYTITQLPPNEFDVSVLFLQAKGPASELYRSKGIIVKHLTGIQVYQHAYGARIKWLGRNPIRPITQFIRMLLSVPKMMTYLKANCKQVNIVHINTSVMLPVGIACKLMGLKVVWHNREVLYPGVLGIRRFIASTIIKWCSDKVIHISKMGEQSMGNSKKNEVIYNFIDFEKFDKTLYPFLLHDELGLSHEIKIIAMLGGVVHSKGADVFVNAISEVLANDQKVHFVIVGYPPMKQEISQGFGKIDMGKTCLDLIAKNNLSKWISFTGLRNDIPKVLASTYLLVWPATVPHFSRPIIEAQAMGIPPIGTDFEVTREVIQEGETGLTFVNGDSTSLAKQINLLLNDSALYNKISQQAYQQAKERFSADTNVKKIVAIYHSLH